MAEFGVGVPDTGGTIVFLQVVPDLLHHSKVGDGSLDRRGHPQGDVTECLFIVFIPRVMFVSGLSGGVNEPLALHPEVGLHGGMPLLPVRTSEDRDHLVKSAGHGDRLCLESTESASECDIRQARTRKTPSA